MSNEYGQDRQEDIWARCGWEGDTLLLPRSAIELEAKVRNDFTILSPCFVESEILNCESDIVAFDKDKVLVEAFP